MSVIASKCESNCNCNTDIEGLQSSWESKYKEIEDLVYSKVPNTFFEGDTRDLMPKINGILQRLHRYEGEEGANAMDYLPRQEEQREWKQENFNLMIKVKGLMRGKESLQQRLEALRDSYNDVVAEKEALKAKIERMQEKLQENREKLYIALDQSYIAKGEVVAENKDLRDRVAELTSEITRIQNSYGRVVNENTDLRKENDDLKRKIIEMK